MNMNRQNRNHPPVHQDYTILTKDLNDRFSWLVMTLGPNNKVGSQRHQFEVDFAYSLNELENSPRYIQGKMYDQAVSIVQRVEKAKRQG